MTHDLEETDGGNVHCKRCDKFGTSERAMKKTECNPEFDRGAMDHE